FRFRERVAEILTHGQWANDPERELAEVTLQVLDRQATAKTTGDVAESARCEDRLRDILAWTRALAFHPDLKPRRKQFASFVHPRDKDSCSRGRAENEGRGARGEGRAEDKDGSATPSPLAPRPSPLFKRNPLGIELEGCPLNEKISEAHLLKREGHGVGALAMIMVDNPLCAGTGHRICNDCMKSCICQKQTPVNIPQIETSILSDVLQLPYGFEIYSLLARWNPLNLRRPF